HLRATGVPPVLSWSLCWFLNNRAPTEIYTLSLHDALPISTSSRATRRHAVEPLVGRHSGAAPRPSRRQARRASTEEVAALVEARSEEHTSELQSLTNIVCRLLLEKKR